MRYQGVCIQTTIHLGHYILENTLEIGGITNLKTTRIEHEGVAHTFFLEGAWARSRRLAKLY